MVKVCDLKYPLESENLYQTHYDKYSYTLHDFQKWAIESIVTGNHVLITAPTGSGKTMPGDFALDYFASIGKKTIYCSPIKALSNQKFYDFTHKYPNISIGLITGDIKTNPDATVLIMTTEILLNKLYQLKSKNKVPTSSISFEMDIENELGCVIFDEIHYINDPDRGHVWENCIMLLPKHVQMIGLSATLDNPEKFASWLENRGEPSLTQNTSTSSNTSQNNHKTVYLASKKNRAVPLTHYSFITTTTTAFKNIKDKALQEEIKSVIDKPFVIQDSKGTFNDEHYFRMNKVLKLFEKNDIYVKRQHVLNQVSKYLVEKEMLPAVCYVFSRKQVEVCAKEITTNLLEFDSKVPYIVDRECEQIIRKLPNYQEYLHLPEYLEMVTLLRKGVAMHHAGLLPVLREIVELLFAKGYIKLLFCTETIAVGLNLPVKTTIFTDVNKFDGNNNRVLLAHEYTQAAGRAGRLGLDTVGHVFHLNNLFKNVDSVSYKKMMNGKPQSLVSKFKISFHLLLSLIDIGSSDLFCFAKRSMITEDICSEIEELKTQMNIIQTKINDSKSVIDKMKTPIDVVNTYLDYLSKRETSINKKRKEIDRQIQTVKDNHKFIDSDMLIVEKYNKTLHELSSVQSEINNTTQYIDNNVLNVCKLLENEGFVVTTTDEETKTEMKLTLKGMIATHLRELHCLAFADLLEEKELFELSSKQLVAIFSCFTNITVSDNLKSVRPKCENDIVVEQLVNKIEDCYLSYLNKEQMYHVNTGADYNMHFDLLNYVEQWCDCKSVEECKYFLQTMEKEKGIFLGEFVKALLKMNNIASEMEQIAELIGNVEFLSKLREIPNMTLKYVVTNQSLYV
jgi:superfamily II RNA helicase